jgi:hypothetical protein
MCDWQCGTVLMYQACVYVQGRASPTHTGAMGLLGNMMSRLCGHHPSATHQRCNDARTVSRHRQYTEAADAAAAIAAAAAARAHSKPEAAPTLPGLALKRQNSLSTTSRRGSIDVTAAVAAAERVASMTSRHLVVTTDTRVEPGVALPVTPRHGSHTSGAHGSNSPRSRQSMEVTSCHTPRGTAHHRRPKSPGSHSRRGSFDAYTLPPPSSSAGDRLAARQAQAAAQWQQQLAGQLVGGYGDASGCLSPRRSLPSGLGQGLPGSASTCSTPGSSNVSILAMPRASA